MVRRLMVLDAQIGKLKIGKLKVRRLKVRRLKVIEAQGWKAQVGKGACPRLLNSTNEKAGACPLPDLRFSAR
jgi:hypothetical protein